jgi:EAL domain-containing protein (putative c-di-GMP-specific phosphodiesterase class I)
VLALVPDVVKVDRSIVSGLQHNGGRRALVAALVAFTDQTGAVLVAEGIEDHAELAVLRELGVTGGQGFLLGRPGPLPGERTVRT